MYCNLCLALLVLIGPAISDKSVELGQAADKDSYENGVGTSFTVPLNPQIVPKVSKNARKYSVSGDDLERSDLSLSPSYQSPVVSYSAPFNNLDTFVAPGAQDVAQARDGAGGHHHHHDHHQHHAAHEAAPAPAAAASFEQPAVESSYQAPASTGNLYYYYYPVAAYPLDEKNDSDELDPLVLVLLPVSILIGFLALLSIFNVSVTGRGRSFQSKSDSVYGTVDQLKAKVDTLLENYYLALESESCMDRVVCELGTQATNLSGKTLLMSALDWFTPAPMQSRIEIFKEAANEGYPVHICKSKYYCDSQNLIQTRRK